MRTRRGDQRWAAARTADVMNCGRPGTHRRGGVRGEGASGNRHDARKDTRTPAPRGCGWHYSGRVTSRRLFRPRTMNVAIVGGTGTVGAEAARELERARARGARAVAARAEYPVDLRDGSGLAAALAGVEVVVDAANGDRKVLVDGTARLLRAGAEAGVKHHVGVSIVGIDRVGGRYYKAKLEQEQAIRARRACRGRSCARRSSTRSWRARSPRARSSGSCLGRDPDAARRSTRGRPRAGRDGRGRALAGDHAVRRPGGAQRARAGPALAARRPARTRVPVALPGARARCAPAG